MFTQTVTSIKGQLTLAELHRTTLQLVLLLQKKSFKKGFIMGYIYFTLATFLLAAHMAVGVPADCGQTYQNTLQSLLTQKENCETAGFKDCCQVKELVPLAATGTYDIGSPCGLHDSFSYSRFRARCDMETVGGKWLVIQRRINGSVDFYRNWTDYVHGFGDLEGEFWYGLENIHCLTTREDVELRIEVGNETTPSIVWTYQLFRVGGAATDYILTIGEGQGTNSQDNMAYHNGRPFSTRDHDNDGWNRNCAAVYGGAWWYRSCFHANLNGGYTYHTPEDGQGNPAPGANRLSWYDGSSWQNSHYTKAEMKIRPKRAGCGAPSSTCN